MERKVRKKRPRKQKKKSEEELNSKSLTLKPKIIPRPKLPRWILAMTPEDREKTRPGRIKTLLEEIMYNEKIDIYGRMKAIDLLCKVMNMYKAINEVYIVEPIVIKDESGNNLATLATRPREDMVEVVNA